MKVRSRAYLRRKAWRLFVESWWSFERIRSCFERVHGVKRPVSFVEQLVREEYVARGGGS